MTKDITEKDMDTEEEAELGSLDAELLKLPDVSPLLLNPTYQVAEGLFSQWLSLPSTVQLVKSLIDGTKAGASFTSISNPAGVNLLPSFLAGSTPPVSPKNSSGSLRFMKQRSSICSLGSLAKLASGLNESIPQFYFQDVSQQFKEQQEQWSSRISDLFNGSTDGLQIHEFKSVTREICGLPSFFSAALFKKIDTNCTGNVTRDSFVKYWFEGRFLMMDAATKFFNILRQPEKKYLTQADFKPVLQELLATHSGLEFLQSSSEFQEKYAETVIYRIFYYNNRSGNGRLTLIELKRGNLIAAMQHLDDELDVNKVVRYFSYEHFYVIYCNFWELDTDHDSFIDKDSLSRYGGHVLSYKIVERIFSQVPRKFTSNVEGKMGYEDFVHFILAEEDKSSEPSLEYWFKCIDLDGNGVLTANEMQYFYEEQLQRMNCVGREPVPFEDALCQIFDMISPERKDYITLHDIKGCKLSVNVFNFLFNLKKFLAYDDRDQSFMTHQRDDPNYSEWDWFAMKDYVRLTMEEDGGYDSSGSEEVWDKSFEAPF